MAKEKSLFKKYVDRLVPKLEKLVEKVNDKRKDERTYLHKDTSIMRKEFKSDNKWEASSVNTTYIAADFMAFDSPVDIKTRPTLSKANGKLPKAGIGRNLTESELTDLQIMASQGTNEARVAKKIADDLVFCDVGLDELYEWAFLYGLYWGFVGMPDIDNPQNMMVLDFQYDPANTYGTEILGVITLDDIDRIFDAAEANQDSIDTMWISKAALKELRQTRRAKELYADYEDKIYDEDTVLKTPSEKNFKEAFEAEYECKLRIINRTIVFEKNGRKIKRKPWGNERVIFTCNPIVGTFAYGQLAENNNRVPGVAYSLIDDYKLVSRYSVNDPSLVEKTTGQGIAAPIIEDVDQIYILDSTHSVEKDSEAEGEDTNDEFITYEGKKYAKGVFVAALNAITGGRLTVSSKDDVILAKVNTLSDEQEDAFRLSISNSYTPTIKLSKTAASVAVSGNVTLTATTVPASATVTWASSDSTVATVDGGVVSGLKAGTANITASITVSGTIYTATCAVTVA